MQNGLIYSKILALASFSFDPTGMETLEEAQTTLLKQSDSYEHKLSSMQLSKK
jgi:hypothetical protein